MIELEQELAKLRALKRCTISSPIRIRFLEEELRIRRAYPPLPDDPQTRDLTLQVRELEQKLRQDQYRNIWRRVPLRTDVTQRKLERLRAKLLQQGRDLL